MANQPPFRDAPPLRGLSPDNIFTPQWQSYLSSLAQVAKGSFKGSGTSSITVTDSKMFPDSFILICPTSAAGATKMGGAGCLYISAKTIGSFTVSTANGSTISSAATFDYILTG